MFTLGLELSTDKRLINCSLKHQWEDSSKTISSELNFTPLHKQSSENYEQISLESKTLTEKLLNTPWEQIQSTNLADTREGYVFVATKKAVMTIWTKNFCTYNRNSKILKLTPYTQYQDNDNNTEILNVISCRRRSNDSIDRRWCFDIEVSRRSTPLTLQAQCLDDLHEWLLVMDGKEPIYEDRRVCLHESDNIQLNDKSYEFLLNLIHAIEKNGIQVEGIYRTCGVKSKVASLIKQALWTSQLLKELKRVIGISLWFSLYPVSRLYDLRRIHKPDIPFKTYSRLHEHTNICIIEVSERHMKATTT
ncbi:unnamed protein product [Schistosoma margrebowiei]|uniref:Uncharacterized protein n=1 Tax=Schistosoma margrebowiei TaxID=48269 RepID=A0A183LFV8_9TREM|nr:unnamed protein product [Schistosoma margrebowiei]